MTQFSTVAPSLSNLGLSNFLGQPETKPAREYWDGEIHPKPMPKARHSRLQSKLISAINDVAEPQQLAYAFPELRCTFGDRSIVPDIAVFRWANIALDADGEPVDHVMTAPNWILEILSPDQSSNRVIDKILHSLKHGSELGWLIDPSDRSLLIFAPHQQPEVVRQDAPLPVLPGLALTLSPTQVFAWLNMKSQSS
jgi:Uma2 family endonuclease